MSRLDKVIAAQLAAGSKLLIPYIVAGDPDLDGSLALMHGLVSSGADIIELGIPFSDPSSDGPVIQQGAERALANGTGLIDVLALVAKFRETNTTTPVVLMGYLNPLEIMGYQVFAERAGDAGIDGVLIVDLPPSESVEIKQLLAQHQIDVVFLVAPTTTQERAVMIAEHSSGYLYYVSLKGVTGAALTDTATIEDKIRYLRQISDLPVVIGFGIKDGDSAATMATLADGIVIGSALVDIVAGMTKAPTQRDANIDAVKTFISAIRKRLDNLK